MASIREQPKNMNPLTDVQFKFEIAALPNTSFFIQGVNIPGISLEAQSIGLPQVSSVSRHTGIISYEQLTVSFLIDEYLQNWMEVFNWMTDDTNKYTSAVLTILSSSMNPTMEAHFKEIFPTSLSEVAFDSSTADPTYAVASVSFNYTEFNIKTLLNNPR